MVLLTGFLQTKLKAVLLGGFLWASEGQLQTLCCQWLRPEMHSKEQGLDFLEPGQLLTTLWESSRPRCRSSPGDREEAVAGLGRLVQEAGSSQTKGEIRKK